MEKIRVMNKKIVLLLLISLYSKTVFGQNLHFTDITKTAGIKHQFKVLEGMFGGGVCVFDYNNDGYDDLYITGGLHTDALYKNNKNGSFSNVIQGSGLDATQKYVTQGVASADVNNDGFRDLLVTTISLKNSKKRINRAIKLLFLNNRNGKFTMASKAWGLDKQLTFSTSASFGDFNADGWPDLFIGNYFNEFDGSLNKVTDAMVVGANQIARPSLYINLKGKGFKDITQSYGLNFRGFGFGGVFTDFDNDGDQDIIVNHDFGYKRTPNMLMQNMYPIPYFRNVATKKGMDLKINAMGAAVADIDANGSLDYFVTNIRSNKFMVYNTDTKVFEDKSAMLGTAFTAISWGANFGDFDHDGDQDLFVANGDLNPNCNPMSNYFFENKAGKYTETSRAVGLAHYGIARGSAVLDIENDGDLDIFVVNQAAVCEQYPVETVSKLFRNDLLNVNNWLKIKLLAKNAAANGIGARLSLYLQSGQHLIQEIDGGASSQYSQSSSIVHFGVAPKDQVLSLEISWSNGRKQIVKDLKMNTLNVISEESSFAFIGYSLLITIITVIFICSLMAVVYIRKKNTKPWIGI
jgi:enediyne biosynthesis protein E4